MENQRTPLFSWHTANGATIATFHGWDMPLWYPSGAKKEHLSVITGAGMFDTSHMGAISVTGHDAYRFIQLCFSKDISRCLGPRKEPLRPGRSVYGVFLNERGETVDDSILFHLAEERYVFIVNASMSAKVTSHLQKHMGNRAVTVTDISARMGKIDLQGPSAARILAKSLKGGPGILRDLVYFSFKGDYEEASGFSGVALADGKELFLSRTGYTGEFGFELFMKPDILVRVWEALLEAGKEFNLMPCGLAARDSLRAGAGLPLSQQDIGAWPYINHPWHFALPFDEEGRRFTKQFVGDIVLQLKGEAGHTLPFAGYDPRKVATQEAVVMDEDDKEIGSALTCVADLAIGRGNSRIYSVASPNKPENFSPLGLCCGFVKVRRPLSAGAEVALKDNRRKILVEIVDDIRPDRTARRPMREFLA